MSQTNEERKGHLSLLLSYLFGTHRFKHLLKLDTQLLDIIHQDARLRTKREIQTALLEEKKTCTLAYTQNMLANIYASKRRQTKCGKLINAFFIFYLQF